MALQSHHKPSCYLLLHFSALEDFFVSAIPTHFQISDGTCFSLLLFPLISLTTKKKKKERINLQKNKGSVYIEYRTVMIQKGIQMAAERTVYTDALARVSCHFR